jgi:hypothetical protein
VLGACLILAAPLFGVTRGLSLGEVGVESLWADLATVDRFTASVGAIVFAAGAVGLVLVLTAAPAVWRRLVAAAVLVTVGTLAIGLLLEGDAVDEFASLQFGVVGVMFASLLLAVPTARITSWVAGIALAYPAIRSLVYAGASAGFDDLELYVTHHAVVWGGNASEIHPALSLEAVFLAIALTVIVLELLHLRLRRTVTVVAIVAIAIPALWILFAIADDADVEGLLTYGIQALAPLTGGVALLLVTRVRRPIESRDGGRNR